MRFKITLKADAAELANGRSLNPWNVVMGDDGRLLHPRYPGSTLGAWLEEVTDLFDVEVVQGEWQVVLTQAQLDAVRGEIARICGLFLLEHGNPKRDLFESLKDAFSKARRVE